MCILTLPRKPLHLGGAVPAHFLGRAGVGLQLILKDAAELRPQLWAVEVPPYQLTMLGRSKVSSGPRSILLVDGAMFDQDSRSLRFDAEKVTVLNLGTTKELIVIGS